MIIIVDGPRGSGKTHLCDKIEQTCETFKLQTVRWKSIRGDDPFEEMLDAIDDWDQHPHTVYIVDRFSLTEFVFSIWHERVFLYELIRQIKTINAKLHSAKAIHIVLMADLQTLEERLEDRPEGRRWDMPKEVIRPLWTAAIATAVRDEIWMEKHETEEDTERILGTIFEDNERMKSLAYLSREGSI